MRKTGNTGSPVWPSVMTQRGEVGERVRLKTEGMYVQPWLIHAAVQWTPIL